MESEEIRDRRPIKARQTRWATSAARLLQQRGATPNGISVASSVCALLAAAAFYGALNCEITALRIILFLLAALIVQGRLICNLLDGMVAVEGGLRSPVGAVFNDLPDRVSGQPDPHRCRLRTGRFYRLCPAARLGGGADGSDDRLCPGTRRQL